MRFKDIQIADFGSTVSQDSSYARKGDSIGTPIFRSPEAQIQMRWGTATDIWSFGATVRYLRVFSSLSFFFFFLGEDLHVN